MVPLPEHENVKENIGDFVKALLEQIDIEFVPTVVTWARW